MFLLGTETDHVAPWKSVYKLVSLTHNELTFALTSGGHNAGVVSGPQHPRRRYRLRVRKPGGKYIEPSQWMASTQPEQGSWWPAWNAWLDERTSSKVAPPQLGAPRRGLKPIREAPGEYVFG